MIAAVLNSACFYFFGFFTRWLGYAADTSIAAMF